MIARPRVGIVGAGFMGTTHAVAWAAEGVPRTVYSTDRGRAEGLAATVNAAVAGSLDELIESCDIVDICTPTDRHAPMALAAAAAGRHVICEKPLARTVEDAERMIAACEAAGVRLFAAQVLRYVPEYAAAHRLVAEGRIGDSAVLRLKRAAFRPQHDPDHWLFDVAASGGIVLDLMIHDMDYARWTAGEVVSAHCRSVTTHPGLLVEHAFVILTHAAGAISHLTGSWAYAAPTFRTSLEIAGSSGLITYDSERAAALTPYLHEPGGGGHGAVGISHSLVADDPFRLELRDFLRAIRDGGEAIVSARDGLAALRIGLAAVESSRTGRVVRIASDAA